MRRFQKKALNTMNEVPFYNLLRNAILALIKHEQLKIKFIKTLAVQDIDLTEHTLCLYNKKTYLPLKKTTVHIITQYLKARCNYALNDFLFINHLGTPLTGHQIARFLKCHLNQ